MSVPQVFSALSIGTIAFSALVSTAIAQPAPRSNNPDPLSMVMVDQAQLSDTQRNAFQRFLQTANFPRTKVGKRCQFYGKPDVWCLLLDKSMAQKVYNQLRQQREFGTAAALKEVRRLTSPERS